MKNIISAEFFKVRKDKALKIIFLVTIGFAFLNIILLLVIDQIVGNTPMPEGYNFNFDPSTKNAFLSGFNIANNFGLIFPIAACIYVGKEFSYGTIRNKIVSGKKRHHIYFANLLTVSLIGLVLLLVYSGTIFLFGMPIYGYGTTFNITEFLFVLKTFSLGYLLFLVSLSISIAMSFILKNQTMALVFSILILAIAGVITTTLATINEKVATIFTYIPFYQSVLLTTGIIPSDLVLKIVLSSILSIVLINFLGLLVFKKTDIK
jgi:ABC-type transport system involved in multi-copper enzyme maturation permease subunit